VKLSLFRIARLENKYRKREQAFGQITKVGYWSLPEQRYDYSALPIWQAIDSSRNHTILAPAARITAIASALSSGDRLTARHASRTTVTLKPRPRASSAVAFTQ
jgi:hypothetical protein